MIIPQTPNQGQKIVPGWDNESTLKNWTAYSGTDGVRFFPPSDRKGYTPGVARRLATGGVAYSGFPVVRLTFPWISDGQIEYLSTTLSGNVTVAVHTPLSVGREDVFHYNAVLNLNLEQVAGLTRKRNGYEGFVVELVLVEAL